MFNPEITPLDDLVHDIFCQLGFESDFAKQSDFCWGGTNRVLLNIRTGLWTDTPYCTPKFLAAFNEWKNGKS